MFKFDFQVGDNNEQDMGHQNSDNAEMKDSGFVQPERLTAQMPMVQPEAEEIEAVMVEDFTFKKRVFLGETTALRGVVQDSDLQPSIYEGGFKVWECGIDLAQHLIQMSGVPNGVSNKRTISVVGKNVIEVGCGHGLPGIYCLQQGARHVCFQDLNKEVLEHCTFQNIRLNCGEFARTEFFENTDKLSVFCGDWNVAKLAEMMVDAIPSSAGEKKGYDLLLTSDTLYSSKTLPVLIRVIDAVLAPDGVALVAAKRFYFGVGGSTGEFMGLLDEYKCTQGGRFEGISIRTFENGKSNIRELIQITRKKNAE